MVEFKVFGDWNRVQRAISRLPATVKASALWGQRKAAERIVKIARAHIDKQDLGWTQRSDRSSVGDSRILVSSGDYYDNIKAWRKNDIYYAGIKTDAYNGKGIRISDYAILHEYGTDRIPARPLWGPTADDIGGPKGIREIVLKAIHNKIQILRADGFDISFRL